jgi:RNA polymerase sigma-70 factor (ECF subfamily)
MTPASEQTPPAPSAAVTPARTQPDIAPETIAAARASFLDFYDQEYLQVVRFLVRYGASPSAAEDPAQDAFTEAWALTFPPCRWLDIDDPRGWIRTVALRKYLRPPGPRRRPPTVLVPEPPEMPELAVGPAELTIGTLFVLTALRSLDPESRAVMAFHLDGFTSPQIASYLGIKDQKARDLLKKARKNLAAQLAEFKHHEGRPLP